MAEALIKKELDTPHEHGSGYRGEPIPEQKESYDRAIKEPNKIHEENIPTVVVTDVAPVTAEQIAARDPELVAIENVLEENLGNFFANLKYQQQIEFKETGEAAALKIKTILHHGVYRIKDIVSIITNWLKSLPGINKFFLEQEAKIKADKIIDLYK
jgi:hypothetical protein